MDRCRNYTHWQVLLLRDALEAYRRFAPDGDAGKRPLSWNTLRERVSAVTNIEFGKDDLRQFVEGKKQGQANFRLPNPHRLEALFQFLTDEYISMITADEFEQAELVGVHAPLHLSRYLTSLEAPSPIEFPRSLVGQFDAIGQEEGRIVLKSLHIVFEGRGFASVNETDEIYNLRLPSGSLSDKMLRKKISTRRKADARIRYGGWAIITPEDNLLLFMKAIDTRENHFWKFSVEHPIWEKDLVTALLLNKFDWPFYLDHEASTGEAISLSLQRAASDTWHFIRRGNL